MKRPIFLIISVVVFVLSEHSLFSDAPLSIKQVLINPSGVDSVITFYANDTMKIDVANRKGRLISNASIEQKKMKITAGIIEIDFNTSTLIAQPQKDTNGHFIDIPAMTDNGETYYGASFRYNMKLGTGTISSGETQLGEGFYYGNTIRRVAKDELYIKDGFYTTCDAPHPHYHFGADKMKMLVGNKIFVDRLSFFVSDIPIFTIPFSMYLPIEKGRRSGLIVPSFYFSSSRGVVFQNLGYYWAASDYWDTKLTADIYTKGGFILNNSTQWKLTDVFSGNANISFGNTKYVIDDPYSKAWKFGMTHQQTLSPFESMSANLNFASSDFERNTSTNLNNRIEQSIRSSAQYSRTFENGINAALSLQNEQNIITNEYTGSVPLSVSVPQMQPLKNLLPKNLWYSWMRDITFNYRGNANYNFSKKTGTINTIQTDTGLVFDTSYNYNSTGYITHTPSISISPKFGFFNVTPNVSFGANNFFRRVIKEYDADNNSVIEHFERGFWTEYYYNFGIGLSTRIYGVANDKNKLFWLLDPNSIGLKAIRHTYQPNISFNYSPDFSTQDYDFYGRYTDANGRENKYSFFEREGGSHASSSLQKRISYSDVHSLEIKRKINDTTDENLELLRLSLSLSHNFAADSIKFSDIATTLRAPAIKFVDMSANANFTIYDEQKDDFGTFHKINQFLVSNGKGLARMTYASISLSTSFSDNGFSNSGTTGADTNGSDTTKEEEKMLGSRFVGTREEKDGDIFGEHTDGYSPINIPWNITLGLNFSYNQSQIDKIERRLDLNTSINFTIAESWKVSTGFQYDFISKQLITPKINITKDLHCWDLTASWYPSGYNRGFYLRFGIKSAQLRDLKIEKHDSPVFR